MERQVLFGFFLVVVQLILLCPQGEAQYGPPYGEGGWGGGYVPPAFSRSGSSFPSVNCSELVCGLGSCNSSSSSSQNGSSYSYSYSYNYTGSLCTCKQGWLPSFTGNPSLYPYSPCVRPNCTITENCPSNYTRPSLPDPNNATALNDPCAWMDCAEGKCVAINAYKFRCECNAGFKNLFNDTSFPCLSDCMLSDECKSMGASFSANATAQSGGGGNGGEGGTGNGEGGSGGSRGGNKGVAVVPGKLLGLALLVIGVAVV